MATRKVTKTVEVEEEIVEKKYIIKTFQDWNTNGDGDLEETIYDDMESAKEAAKDKFEDDIDNVKVEIYELPEKPVVIAERKIVYTDVV